MDLSRNDHLQRTADAVEDWLRPDSSSLKRAIDRTVGDKLFSFPDIKHRVRALRASLSLDALASWADEVHLKPGELKGYRALCLHAGNFPAAGIQDLLACTLSGCSYTGKISRKDPWILASLLEVLVRHKALNDSHWSADMDRLSGSRADCVLFSGAGRSVSRVRETIRDLDLARKNAPFLIRTAQYSLAFITSTDPVTMQNLTEAVFRYGGRGCRSVALVVAPFDLDSVKCEFTDYVESFWLNNPQHEKPPPSLWFRYAYNKAAGHRQSWLDDFLIEETVTPPGQEFVLHWVQGDEKEMQRISREFSAGLQSVYVPHRDIRLPRLDRETELLSTAQSPPLNWKPDGTDSIEWLLQEAKRP